MQQITSIKEMRVWCERVRKEGEGVVFVPTMGALHEGHLSLIRLAQTHGDRVVVSIFVNPTQFGPSEDFNKYPRTLESDAAQCEALGVDLLFVPSAAEMYPACFQSEISVRDLSQGLCGGRRPGHFAGVCTVVAKLFNIVQPQVAVFGQKDYQQLAVIRQMVRDFDFSIQIVGAPTVREHDGLAMSSRNAYLTPSQRRSAAVLYRSLASLAEYVQHGEQADARQAVEMVQQQIEAEPEMHVDYIALRQRDTLQPLSSVEPNNTVVLVAVYLGETRLIDNMLL